MAFHFTTHFRKYQKVWMAGLVLMSMVTFVLCTGVGGDLSEMLLNYFQRRSGNVIVKVDGRSYKTFDISELKTQRSVANEFMKKAADYYIKGIDGFVMEVSKDTKKLKEEDRKAVLPRMELLKGQLLALSKKRWYFDSGTKLEELADFLMWRAQADRLGIYLVDEHVREMVRSELFQPWVAAFSGQQIPTDLGWLTLDLRRDFPKMNESVLHKALEDEFRVRLAQLAILNAQPDAYRERGQELKGFEQIKTQYFQSLEKEGGRHGLDTRAVATPEQMWEMFKKKRAEFDVALVPVPVEQFIDKIKPPTDAELQAFFNDHKKLKYDPSSDKPGFEIPHRVKVEWVTADPESAFYKNLSKTALALETTPPVLPSQYPLSSAVLYALGRMPLDVRLYQDFQRTRGKQVDYLAAWLNETDVLAPILDKFYKPTPASVAAIVGSTFRDDLFAAAVASYRVPVYEKHKNELPAILAAEAKARSPIYATLVSTAIAAPFQSLLQYELAGRLPQFLPIEVARADLVDFAERKVAGRWITRNMSEVKKVLENPRIIGKPREVFEDKLQPLVQKYGLTRGESKDFIDRFTAGKAAELKPLREAWERAVNDINTMEGRGGTDRALKEEDFQRMFFDSGESFSTGVVLFDARAWPPVIKVKDARTFADPTAAPKTISLFEMSEKPILFWKAADQPAQPAESLALVRDKVERAWKIEKARQQLAIPQAKEIAERLQKSTGVLGPVVHEEAKKLGKDPIFLNNLAPMVKQMTPFGPKTVDYGEYQLPRDVIDYPREDTVKNLLSLTELKDAPLKVENTEIDNINKKLWETTKNLPAKEALLRNVQIISNKPRTMLYVATVSVPPHASKADFDEAFKQAVGLFGGPYNAFVRRAHEAMTKEYRQAIVEQLRKETGHWFDPNEVKQFDQDTAP